MAINLDAVGAFDAPVERSWDESDCMLYALSIGLGYPDYTQDLEYTTENTKGIQLRTVPTFTTVIGRNQEAEWLAFPASPGQTYLASEEIVLSRDIPTSGRVRVHTQVRNIYDKGSGALLEMFSTATETTTEQVLFTRAWTVFIRDEGGFGGEKGPSIPKWETFVPTHTFQCRTNPISALLYRLLDSRSQIHSDPKLALDRGFKRPIMHGRGTLGYACQMLVRHFPCKPGQRVGSISGYFSRPLLPGDAIRLEASWESADALAFQLRNDGDELVLSAGRLGFVAA